MKNSSKNGRLMSAVKSILGKRKPKLDTSALVTAGVTADGKYSLAVQRFDGRPCLCVHKCTVSGGLHYSSMDKTSLVTALDMKTLAMAIGYAEERAYLFQDEKEDA